jgi:hypothetical protein
MDDARRAELIELAAICQFKADHPGRDWNGVQASSAEMDKRAQYLFYAEEYLVAHRVITPIVTRAV